MTIGKVRKYSIKAVTKHPERCVQSIELDNGPTLELTQSWYNGAFCAGDRVTFKVSSEFDGQTVIRIDDSNGFVVLDPDHLITITDLSSTSFCLRKTWLSNRFKVTIPQQKAFLIGDLVHCMFQETINDRHPSRELMFSKLKQLIRKPNSLKSLLFLDLDEREIIDEAKEYIDSVLLFNKKFNSGIASNFDEKLPNLKLKVNKVTDIEDTVISPIYGMKGTCLLVCSLVFIF